MMLISQAALAAVLASALLFASPGPIAVPAAQQPAAQPCPKPAGPPAALGEQAKRRLDTSIAAARQHRRHIWRDTAPVNADSTVNVYVEIARGSREKWEFDMKTNRRQLNRVVPESLGGYPIAYGFVPGTINLDGDPFDGLVIGEPAAAGTIVRGYILGILHMTDEKGSDSKIVVSPETNAATRRGLLEGEKVRIAEFFNRYKAVDDDAATSACVSGWGNASEARKYVEAASRLMDDVRTRK